jgi:uncharacterized protein YunC (DUF1805 family)
MSKEKVLEDYFEITIAKSNNWTCHKCSEKVETGHAYLLMRRNRHIYVMCGKCIVLSASKVMEIDPSVQEKCIDPLL